MKMQRNQGPSEKYGGREGEREHSLWSHDLGPIRSSEKCALGAIAKCLLHTLKNSAALLKVQRSLGL